MTLLLLPHRTPWFLGTLSAPQDPLCGTSKLGATGHFDPDLVISNHSPWQRPWWQWAFLETSLGNGFTTWSLRWPAYKAHPPLLLEEQHRTRERFLIVQQQYRPHVLLLVLQQLYVSLPLATVQALLIVTQTKSSFRFRSAP